MTPPPPRPDLDRVEGQAHAARARRERIDIAPVLALVAYARSLETALTHYANPDHWDGQAGHGPYTVWEWDGGDDPPWMGAADALDPGRDGT